MPSEALERLREQCPVAQVRTGVGQPVWLVLRDEEVRACLTDSRLSTSCPGRPAPTADRRMTDVTLMSNDLEWHARVRRLANPALSARRMESFRPQIAAIAADTLRTVPGSGTADLMSGFARPFVIAVMCEVFGIAEAAQAALRDLIPAIFDHHDHPAEARGAAVDGVESLLRAELARREELAGQGRPGNDVLSAILAAWRADGTVSEADLISLCGMLVLAGSDSAAQMIGSATVTLLTHPADLARLRTEPAMLPRAVEELLRWDTPGPLSSPRWATEDITVGGTAIPSGGMLMMSVAAANLDPRTHDAPGLLSLSGPGVPRHVSFGLGPHFCPGSPLARIELIAALNVLISTYPAMRLALPASGLRWRGVHHRQLRELPVELAPGR
jgi:cytochrome P450